MTMDHQDYQQGFSTALKELLLRLRCGARWNIPNDSIRPPTIEIQKIRGEYAQYEEGVLLSLPNGYGHVINMLVPFYKFKEMIQPDSGYVVLNPEDTNPNSHLFVPMEVQETFYNHNHHHQTQGPK